MTKLRKSLLFQLQKKKVQVVLAVLVILFLLVLTFLAWKKGPTQYGNFISLIGSLLMAIPPVRQALTNGVFHASETPTNDELSKLDPKIAAAMASAYMKFSWDDIAFYFLGALLLALGFSATILLAD